MQWGGGELHSTARLGEMVNFEVHYLSLFQGFPFFSGIHIIRPAVGTKHSTVLLILFDGPTD